MEQTQNTDDFSCIDYLKEQNQKFNRMLDIQHRLGEERNPTLLAPIVMSEITNIAQAERSSLFLFDWKTMELSTCFAEGLDGKNITVHLKMGIVGTSILNGKTLNICNVYEHPYFNDKIDQISNFRSESMLVTPIPKQSGGYLGSSQSINKQTGRFTRDDEIMVEHEACALSANLPTMGRKEAGKIVASLMKMTCCDRGTIFRIDEEAGLLMPVYAEGVESDEIVLSIKLGIAGLVAVTGEAIWIPDVSMDPRFDSATDKLTGYQTRNMVTLPIRSIGGETLGVVQVINLNKAVCDDEDMTFLKIVVSIMAIHLENAMLLLDQDRQFHSLLEVMASSIDAKDSLTAGHSERVGIYAARIGRELGFTESELDVLKVAATLHDYGKIGISDNVLKKEGKLTDEEYSHIKQHARITHDILGKIHFARKYKSVPMIAGSHHECLNGSGYPDGLNSKEIPFMSKILTVADIYEALTADRHYRAGMPPSKALEILDEGAGYKYDSNLIAALRRVLVSEGVI